MKLDLPPLPTTRGNVDESCERCKYLWFSDAIDLTKRRECYRTGKRTVFERTDPNGCGPDAKYFKERG